MTNEINVYKSCRILVMTFIHVHTNAVLYSQQNYTNQKNSNKCYNEIKRFIEYYNCASSLLLSAKLTLLYTGVMKNPCCLLWVGWSKPQVQSVILRLLLHSNKVFKEASHTLRFDTKKLNCKICTSYNCTSTNEQSYSHAKPEPHKTPYIGYFLKTNIIV